MLLSLSRTTHSLARQSLRQCQAVQKAQAWPPLAQISSQNLSTNPSLREENTFDEFAKAVSDTDKSGRKSTKSSRSSSWQAESWQVEPESVTPITETAAETPRWARTPPLMKSPRTFSLYQAKDPRRKIWAVNKDPAKLDHVYVRLLGPQGAKMLPEEIKWLAVTHKSFDQGRRGFNDRLAFFGRQTLMLEISKAIVHAQPKEGSVIPDGFGRTPFEHKDLAGLDNFNVQLPQQVMDLTKVAQFAAEVGLDKVLRWKPRLPENLEGSGIKVVLNGAFQAIVGAVALQHGAEVAGQIIRERILPRLMRREKTP